MSYFLEKRTFLKGKNTCKSELKCTGFIVTSLYNPVFLSLIVKRRCSFPKH